MKFSIKVFLVNVNKSARNYRFDHTDMFAFFLQFPAVSK